MFDQFRNLLGGLFDKYHLGHGVAAAQAVVRWPEAVRSVLGPDFPVPRALHLKYGRLTVVAENSLVAQEIRNREEEILLKLNASLGEERVHEIHFRSGNPPTEKSFAGG